MAKKSPAPEFNLSETVRGILTANPSFGPKEVSDAILAKYPGANINKGSFSVAFYTSRKKLNIKSNGRGKRVGVRKSESTSAASQSVNLAILQTTAKFLSEIGGAEAAIEAIKQVQAVQVK